MVRSKPYSATSKSFGERFYALMNSPNFEQAVTQGTGDPKKVRLRFAEINRIIQESLA